jgi:hypothetical protein
MGRDDHESIVGHSQTLSLRNGILLLDGKHAAPARQT